MAEKIGQHTHCQICGKAIPVSENLCSEECRQKYQMMVKRRKLWIYVMWFLIFITIAVVIVLPRI